MKDFISQFIRETKEDPFASIGGAIGTAAWFIVPLLILQAILDY